MTDKGTLSGFINFPAQSVVKQLHQQRGGQVGPLGGERDVGANWTLKPINDPDRLKAMRCLYLHVLSVPMADGGAECKTLTQKYLGHKFDPNRVAQCWFRHGGWHEIPKQATIVFHHHGTYFWVVPGGEQEVTRLTLTMLDIATIAPRTMSVEITFKSGKGSELQSDGLSSPPRG